MYLINRLLVLLELLFKLWNVFPQILIGHFSKKNLKINFEIFIFLFKYRFSGKKLPSINLGSYNYLGFAENSGPCSEQAIKSIKEYGVSTCSTRHELGTQKYMIELENLMAKYLNVEDCIAFGMGFATNALNIPVLARQVKLRFFFRKIKLFL